MSAVPDQQSGPKGPSFRGWMGSMWLYTVLRFALFFVMWGVLALLGVGGFLGAVIALVLTMPLSYVLLARPRARFASTIEQRVEARKQARAHLDAELSGDEDKPPHD